MNNKARYIRVYDKNGAKIAEFSNYTTSDAEAQKDLMVAPIVHIVSNGESTLSFEMFADSEKWRMIKAPENEYECGGRRYNALNENSVVYSDGKVQVTLVEKWYELRKKFVQAHNVDPKVEALDEHTVKILPKTDKTFKLTVNGKAYEDSQVVDQRGVQMPRGSAGYALWAVLQDSGWKLGVCDVISDDFDASKDFGTFNVETDMKSVLENIQFIQSLYGGILVWDSENQTVGLRDESKESDFNRWKGFTARKNKNLGSIPVVTWDNNITTRLYPLGNGNLNIKRVNGGKSYIENFSYTNKVYESYIQNANIYDTGNESGQKTLKQWAERQLEKLCRPRKSIQYDIIDMRATNEYSFETFDINDIVKAYYTDEGKEISELLRIQEISYNYFFPSSESTISVGDKVANEIELFNQIYKKSQNDAPTDQNGNVSGEDIYIEIPDFYLPDFGFPEDFESLYGYGYGYASLAELTTLHAYYEHKNEKEIVQAEAAVQVVADAQKAQAESFTAFVKETAENFQQSATDISQISTALDAQITLEASHYEESKNYTNESVASLRTYVDGERAIATLNAAYGYTDSKTGVLSDSVARIKTQADKTSASVDAIAQYGTGSLSYLALEQNPDYPKAEIGVNNGSYVQCAGPLFLYSPQLISCMSPISINDIIVGGTQKSLYFDSKGYLRGR